MEKVEYAVDVWDLSATDGRLNSFLLLKHLRDFGEEGWELLSLTLNIDLGEQGPSHLLVFKRLAWAPRPVAARGCCGPDGRPVCGGPVRPGWGPLSCGTGLR